jgi:hypothetical protein
MRLDAGSRAPRFFFTAAGLVVPQLQEHIWPLTLLILKTFRLRRIAQPRSIPR